MISKLSPQVLFTSALSNKHRTFLAIILGAFFHSNTFCFPFCFAKSPIVKLIITSSYYCSTLISKPYCYFTIVFIFTTFL